MRDIENYAENYLNDDFEYIMSNFRKKLVKKMLEKYKAKNIIDIGPAYNVLFNDYTDFETYTVVEPSIIMAEKIKKFVNDSVLSRVYIINDYFFHS